MKFVHSTNESTLSKDQQVKKYIVKKIGHPPEKFTYTPKIKYFSPESDKKKHHNTKLLIRETSPFGKSVHLRSLIKNHKAMREKS